MLDERREAAGDVTNITSQRMWKESRGESQMDSMQTKCKRDADSAAKSSRRSATWYYK